MTAALVDNIAVIKNDKNTQIEILNHGCVSPAVSNSIQGITNNTTVKKYDMDPKSGEGLTKEDLNKNFNTAKGATALVCHVCSLVMHQLDPQRKIEILEKFAQENKEYDIFSTFVVDNKKGYHQVTQIPGNLTDREGNGVTDLKGVYDKIQH